MILQANDFNDIPIVLFAFNSLFDHIKCVYIELKFY